MFEALRRWIGQELSTEELSVEMTIAAMDAAGVELGVLSAWYAPEGPSSRTTRSEGLLLVTLV
jgi:uncharacterized protein